MLQVAHEHSLLTPRHEGTDTERLKHGPLLEGSPHLIGEVHHVNHRCLSQRGVPLRDHVHLNALFEVVHVDHRRDAIQCAEILQLTDVRTAAIPGAIGVVRQPQPALPFGLIDPPLLWCQPRCIREYQCTTLLEAGLDGHEYRRPERLVH